MTKLMEKALEAVRDWPKERQDEAAALLLALDRLGTTPYRATEDELRAIDEALEQMGRGERASEAQVQEAFARFRK
ncbi:MAG TPA: hypothetical protein VGA46_06780 [Methyloceanibacter sp.]|jgi:hypothetical protein